jgi:Ca-activated chloride channel family protein
MRPIRILGREGQIEGRTVRLDIQNIYSRHEKYAIVEVEIPAHSKDKLRQIAVVRVNYHDMKNNKQQKYTRALDVTFSDSQTKVERNMNKQVLADAVEQIAIENNQRALALRDKGKVKEAEEVLHGNVYYLRSNAKKLDSEKLDSYASDNQKDADNLDDYNWSRQRKVMRESQSSRKTQR